MKSKRLSWIGVGACLLLASSVAAVPYGSQLTSSAVYLDPEEEQIADLSFFLNEAANSVIVEVFGPAPSEDAVRTFDLGALDRGAYSVQWDGKNQAEETLPEGGSYSFRVLTESDGHAEWTNITPTDEGEPIASSRYFYPSGVAVIKSMDSPFFGLVAVASSRATEDYESTNMGLYLLNGDLTWFGGSAEASYEAAKNDPNAPWVESDSWSPWQVKAGRDDGMFYLGDWGTKGTTDAVYRYDMVNPAAQILSPGLGNHGRVVSATTTGTGHGTVLWGVERDSPGTDPAPIATTALEVYRWNIGAMAPFVGDGIRTVPSSGGPYGAIYTLRDLEIDEDGNIYVCNRRWGPADRRFMKFDSEGNGIWDRRGTDLVADGYPTHPDYPLGDGIYPISLAYNDGKLYALDDYIKVVVILDAEDGSVLDHFTFAETETTVAGRALDVDAAGNVYVAENVTETLAVWSPPGESAFTSTYGSQVIIGSPPTGVSSPNWFLYE